MNKRRGIATLAILLSTTTVGECAQDEDYKGPGSGPLGPFGRGGDRQEEPADNGGDACQRAKDAINDLALDSREEHQRVREECG